MRAKILAMFSKKDSGEQISDDALRIVEHILSGLNYTKWDPELQLLLSIAMFPKNPFDSNGEWTKEGRASINLIKHIIRGGNPITVPDILKNPNVNIEYSIGLEDRGSKLRQDLIRLTDPCILTDLIY